MMKKAAGRDVLPHVKLAVLSILVIALLELAALSQHVDGVALSLAIGAVAGLGGYTVREITGRR